MWLGKIVSQIHTKSAVRSNLQVLLAVVVALADVELPLAEPVEEADDDDDEAVPLDVDADALLVTEDPVEVEDTTELTEEEADPLPPAIVNWTL